MAVAGLDDIVRVGSTHRAGGGGGGWDGRVSPNDLQNNKDEGGGWDGRGGGFLTIYKMIRIK